MKKLLIKLIRYYQREISPKKPPTCKYKPTCSNYALDALKKRNFFIAVIISFWRYLRCNRFSKGGYDPVPDAFSKRYKYPCLEDTINKLNFKKHIHK